MIDFWILFEFLFCFFSHSSFAFKNTEDVISDVSSLCTTAV